MRLGYTIPSIGYTIPSINTERTELEGAQRTQTPEIIAYLEGLQDAGAIELFEIPRCEDVIYVWLELLDESKKVEINRRFTVKFGGIPGY